ncbi:MAG: hypothetical protein OQK75_11785 [Gammaproteobacteria bacterium]|nr:hypothetical protein [Gammaproteobacteria bacterium]MCW8988336.1 hypothetical protein [Gammaproteobacteria bacterium]MCW9032127.1 hypothetical protein [Gammaproteobacteria bacterium]
MSVETHRVLIGACGWKHSAWLTDFYEEDLPVEWQLGFYSNEFPVVYVPASDWFDVLNSDDSDAIDMAEWAEDVSGFFRFILEIPPQGLNDEQLFTATLNKAKALGESCLGLVLQLNPTIIDDALLFKKYLDQAKAIAPVCIDKAGNSLTTEIENILVKENISEVWHGGQQGNENLKRGSLAISLVSTDELDMVGLRKVVEVALSASTENCISALCFYGNPPSLEKLRNAEIILNLL